MHSDLLAVILGSLVQNCYICAREQLVQFRFREHRKNERTEISLLLFELKYRGIHFLIINRKKIFRKGCDNSRKNTQIESAVALIQEVILSFPGKNLF